MKQIYIDGYALCEREAAHDLLARTFAFPEYYGRNLDALADCLGDIADETEVAVLGVGPFGEYGEKVRSVLMDAAAKNEHLRLSFPDEEDHRLVAQFFESLDPMMLKSFPAKQKKQMAVMRMIAHQFQYGRMYTEPEVNAVLRGIHEDYAALRRALIDFGLMRRTPNGSQYSLL